jgi:hypothetical protein
VGLGRRSSDDVGERRSSGVRRRRRRLGGTAAPMDAGLGGTGALPSRRGGDSTLGGAAVARGGRSCGATASMNISP